MPEVKKEVFEIEAGKYGFRIYVDGELRIQQEFKPHVEGWQPITEAEANEEADKTVALLSASLPPEPVMWVEEIVLSTGKKVTVTYRSSEALTDDEKAELKSRQALQK